MWIGRGEPAWSPRFLHDVVAGANHVDWRLFAQDVMWGTNTALSPLDTPWCCLLSMKQGHINGEEIHRLSLYSL